MSNPQLYQDPILPQHYSHNPITHTAVSFTWPGRDWTNDDMDSIGTQKLLLLYWVRGVSKQIHICLASTDHGVRDGIVEWRARRLHIPFRATPHSFHNKAFPRTVTFVCCTDFCARARASSCRREEKVVINSPVVSFGVPRVQFAIEDKKGSLSSSLPLDYPVNIINLSRRNSQDILEFYVTGEEQPNGFISEIPPKVKNAE